MDNSANTHYNDIDQGTQDIRDIVKAFEKAQRTQTTRIRSLE